MTKSLIVEFEERDERVLLDFFEKMNVKTQEIGSYDDAEIETDDDEKSWKTLATAQFLDGYDDADSVYDSL